MKNIRKTSKLVMRVLQEIPDTRNSDDLLYLEVCRKIDPKAALLPFWYVLASRNSYGFPPYESVRRTRQKIQQDHPELAGTDIVEGHRVLNEEIVREYARG